MAKKISRKNRIPLEDRVEEDRLANKIDLLNSKRTSFFALALIAGIAISLTTFSTTGHAISSLTNSGQGIIGSLLFVLGLVGLALGSKKNKSETKKKTD